LGGEVFCGVDLVSNRLILGLHIDRHKYKTRESKLSVAKC
jgi:hypothetical protein